MSSKPSMKCMTILSRELQNPLYHSTKNNWKSSSTMFKKPSSSLSISLRVSPNSSKSIILPPTHSVNPYLTALMKFVRRRFRKKKLPNTQGWEKKENPDVRWKDNPQGKKFRKKRMYWSFYRLMRLLKGSKSTLKRC